LGRYRLVFQIGAVLPRGGGDEVALQVNGEPSLERAPLFEMLGNASPRRRRVLKTLEDQTSFISQHRIRRRGRNLRQLLSGRIVGHGSENKERIALNKLVLVDTRKNLKSRVATSYIT
jgi:hypothetical protein